MYKQFFAYYDFIGEADFIKGYRNPKHKIGVTTPFFRDNFKVRIIQKSCTGVFFKQGKDKSQYKTVS